MLERAMNEERFSKAKAMAAGLALTGLLVLGNGCGASKSDGFQSISESERIRQEEADRKAAEHFQNSKAVHPGSESPEIEKAFLEANASKQKNEAKTKKSSRR